VVGSENQGNVRKFWKNIRKLGNFIEKLIPKQGVNISQEKKEKHFEVILKFLVTTNLK